METTMKACPYCAESINAAAKKCRHCGEILDVNLKNQRARAAAAALPKQKKWNPALAAILSFLLPGLGQLYKGKVGAGFLWFILTLIGYAAFIVPGVILHIINVIVAATGDPHK